MVMVELVAALAILTAVMIPLAFGFAQETRLFKSYYERAVAMEIVDGEMEILAAGEWRAFKPGAQTYPVLAESVKNLPPGRFTLTLQGKRIRLEWAPEKPGHGSKVVREATIR